MVDDGPIGDKGSVDHLVGSEKRERLKKGTEEEKGSQNTPARRSSRRGWREKDDSTHIRNSSY